MPKTSTSHAHVDTAPYAKSKSKSSTGSGSGANTDTSATTPSSPGKWTKDQKSALFLHVVKRGERDWHLAVPDKTGKQAAEQWKYTLYPQIRKTCGL